jgi:hypothetical protein
LLVEKLEYPPFKMSIYDEVPLHSP